MALVIGSGIEAARHGATRELIERSAPGERVEIPVGLDVMDNELGGLVTLSHPHGGVAGWGEAYGKRRQCRIEGMTLTPQGATSRVRLADMRASRRLGLYDALGSKRAANEQLDGAGRLLPHNGHHNWRASVAYAYDSLAKVVRQLPIQLLAAEEDGAYFERRSPQLLIRSAFDSGLTGWTTTGGDITAVTTPLFFDSSIGTGLPNVIRIAKNLDTDAAWVRQTTASVNANTDICLGADYFGPTALRYQLQRGVDSRWWDGSAWVVGETQVTFPDVTNVYGRRPVTSGPIGVGASNTTIMVSLGFESGPSVSPAYLAHVQLEARRWPTSRNVTFGSLLTREETRYYYRNDSNRRLWNATRGAVIFDFTPHWSTAWAQGFVMYWLTVYYDASNEIQILYDALNSPFNRLIVVRRAGGTNYAISSSQSLTRETKYRLGFRWSAVTDGELNDIYGTPSASNSWIDLWLNGTKIASGQTLQPIETGTSKIQVGGRADEACEGRMGNVWLLPYVPLDKEMKRWTSL